MTRIDQQVLRIIREQFDLGDADELPRETRLVQDLNGDEIDAMELAIEFEDVFGTFIPDEMLEGWKTVGDALDGVYAAIAEKERT